MATTVTPEPTVRVGTVDAARLRNVLAEMAVFMPQKTGVQFSGRGGQIEIMAATLDGRQVAVTKVGDAPGGSEETGWTVDMGRLRRGVARMSGEVEIEAQGLLFRVKNTRFVWETVATNSEFENGNTPEEWVEIDEDELVGALRFVHRACYRTDDTHLAIRGVKIEGGHFGDRDRHRMMVAKGLLPLAADFIMPLAMVDLLCRHESKGRTVKMGFDRTSVGVQVPSGGEYWAHMVEATYPDWRRVVPGEYTKVVTVDREELMDAVRFALVTGWANAKRVKFRADGDELQVTARWHDLSEASRAAVPVVTKGMNGTEWAMNGVYLLDTLRVMVSPTVRLEMLTADRPVVIRGNDDRGYAVIMPMNMEYGA